MTPARRLVAIVDDDPGVLRAMARLVRVLGFEAATYASGEALLAAASEAPPDLVLLDLHLPGLHGADLLAALKARRITAPVVVMTGLDTPGAREACRAAGAAGYVIKPIHRHDLARLLESTVQGDPE